MGQPATELRALPILPLSPVCPNMPQICGDCSHFRGHAASAWPDFRRNLQLLCVRARPIISRFLCSGPTRAHIGAPARPSRAQANAPSPPPPAPARPTGASPRGLPRRLSARHPETGLVPPGVARTSRVRGPEPAPRAVSKRPPDPPPALSRNGHPTPRPALSRNGHPNPRPALSRNAPPGPRPALPRNGHPNPRPCCSNRDISVLPDTGPLHDREDFIFREDLVHLFDSNPSPGKKSSRSSDGTKSGMPPVGH
jgi:hypothetical protein